jgi:hypothetical protein
MVDPFGVSQTPMRVLAQLLKNKSSEVYVSLMADHVARFIDDPTWEARLTELYGADEWKRYRALDDHDIKRFGLRMLYQDQLKENGAKYVVSFDLFHGKAYKYSIVFGTSHHLGCGLMKTEIWNALGGDEFIASRAAPDQLGLDLELPISARQPERELTAHLWSHFRSQTVTVDALDAWMSTDAHIYAPKHLRPALKLMEGEGRLTVMTPADCRRRGLTYPKKQGYAITFTA